MKKKYIKPSIETMQLHLQQIIAASENIILEDTTPAVGGNGMDSKDDYINIDELW